MRVYKTLFPRGLSILLLLSFNCKPAKNTETYYPGAGDEWQKVSPASQGFNEQKFEEAMAYLKSCETDGPEDLQQMLESRMTGPFDNLVGPVRPRGNMNAMVVKDGFIVGEFGDTRRVDMTFSVTKSFLSTTAALALDEGRIKALQDPVYQSVKSGHFDSPRHRKITWHHLLQQTSEWEGILWEKPDRADRRKGHDRTVNEPGTFWEYNDVRVNLASLALLYLWQRPLPEVLKEKIMEPIAASDTWQWHGYRNSDVVINGRKMNSVSGGGHWGGGMWISSRDMARFGYLFLRRGKWQDKQLFSQDWLDKLRTPTEVEPKYGYMWWLNTDGQMWPGVPEESYAAVGGGSNIIWIYPKRNLVVVIRWIDRSKIAGALQKIVSALDQDKSVTD